MTQYWEIVSSSYFSQFAANIWDTHKYFGTDCLRCQRRFPINRAENSGLYDQFDHVL